MAEQRETGRVTFSHYAEMTDAIRVESLSALRALRGEHIWSDATVEERFSRWGKDGAYVMTVRVHRLPEPVTIDVKDRYAGCKSWVDLDEDVDVAGAVPVLTDDAFGERCAAVKKILAS